MLDLIENSALKIIRLELGPYGTNAYIIVCKKTGNSLAIDAPAEAEEIVRQLHGTSAKLIVVTHDHPDHTLALEQLKAKLGAPLAYHPLDAQGMPLPADISLEDSEVLDIGDLKLKVLHTPGHTPGSICLLVDKYLLAGDTIFPGGPGHTVTPSAFKQITESIKTKILSLPGDTMILPGHGGSALLATEKKAFEAFISKPHTADLHGDVLWLSE